MWKDWKKKVSDFFYEDVLDDDEKKAIGAPMEKRISNNRTVNTKMTYHYPKDRNIPFRFPVIPDHHQHEMEKSKNPSEYKIKQNIRRTYSEKNLYIQGYKRKKSLNELEDIPAYIRRRKAEEREQQNKHVEYEDKDTSNQTILQHTKPDELDRIFKKRDGVLQDEIIQKEKFQETLQQDDVIQETELEQHETTTVQQLPLDKIEVEYVPKIEKSYEPIRDVELDVNGLKDEITESDDDVMYTAPKEMAAIEVPNYLLNDPVLPDEDDSIWIKEQQSLLEQTLTHFNIDAKIVNVTQGPTVTRFEIQPALGVKVSKIRNLSDDIKLNMAAKDIRMEAPIPGKNTIGIEVPNQYPQMVSLQEIIETEEFDDATSPLTIALGLTIEGEPLITDIGKMPHGLIAGATGSGKSVCINTILLSLLYKANHHEVKFLLIDPKMVELTPYNGIPHLIAPVITDVKAATMSLKWAVDEMEARYEKFVEAGVRNITKYNEKMVQQNRPDHKLPYIVIVIDELADLMMVSPQEVEDAICRIAQKARACGMHLLLATQRPSVDVITGLIKANIPTRIAFSVSSQVDSRTMLDTVGAEKLLGKGDMLFIENGANKSLRLQGPFVSDEEIDRVASYMRSIAAPNYLFEQEQLLLDIQDEAEDELLQDVISFVLEQNQASTSLLQRRFRIGYNRAARLIDSLENKGIVTAQNGSKPREVLITKAQIEEQ